MVEAGSTDIAPGVNLSFALAHVLSIPAGGTLLGVELETEHGYWHAKDAYLKRLRRIEGQARGLQRMVDKHLAHCVADAVKDGSEADLKLKEASDAIARLVRS